MNGKPVEEQSPKPATSSVRWWTRLREVGCLLVGLRRHDFRAARTWAHLQFADFGWWGRWCRFLAWSLRQMWHAIPDALHDVRWDQPVSRVPFWLASGNPWENHPWRAQPAASLPDRVDTVVIGCGFTGAAAAYHWSRQAPADRTLAVLEMDDPASGSSGRNEGLVVMGRYYAYVRRTVLPYLAQVRHDLTPTQRECLAEQFARVYCAAAYKNADMIEQTIRQEGIDCDYRREGWVQALDERGQTALQESVASARASGFTDWTSITPESVRQRCGMQVRHNAGFSIAAASFHPARWVWGLLDAALKVPQVQLFTRTRVHSIVRQGDDYALATSRGQLVARHVINATESYTPLLHPDFHDVIQPTQTQAAMGIGGPQSIPAGVGISGPSFFCGRHAEHVMIGSDSTRVPDHEAGRIQPSRFLTKYLLAQLQQHYGAVHMRMTHEWSGTVGYTPDEFPVVGLLDDHRQFVIGGMAGSGTAVSFNAARCICARILGTAQQPDDYPTEYFGPSRLQRPDTHRWPELVPAARESSSESTGPP